MKRLPDFFFKRQLSYGFKPYRKISKRDAGLLQWPEALLMDSE